MVLYVVHPVLEVAVTLAQVIHQQVLHQRLSVIVKPLGEVKFALQDVLVDDKRVVISEGVDAGNHLIDEDSECPPVDWFAVALVLKDFRSQILWSSAQSESSIFYVFGEPKVSEFEVAVSADEHIFWFEVSVDDILGVQVFEDQDDVGGVETSLKYEIRCFVGFEHAFFTQMGEEFSSGDVLHEHV